LLADILGPNHRVKKIAELHDIAGAEITDRMTNGVVEPVSRGGDNGARDPGKMETAIGRSRRGDRVVPALHINPAGT
jgi:hypothetical protein